MINVKRFQIQVQTNIAERFNALTNKIRISSFRENNRQEYEPSKHPALITVRCHGSRCTLSAGNGFAKAKYSLALTKLIGSSSMMFFSGELCITSDDNYKHSQQPFTDGCFSFIYSILNLLLFLLFHVLTYFLNLLSFQFDHQLDVMKMFLMILYNIMFQNFHS